jgi:hypothetical protein
LFIQICVCFESSRCFERFYRDFKQLLTHKMHVANQGMKQNIWTSGSRQGTGKLRWCGTDKPLNVFWPWSQSLANYNKAEYFLSMQHAASGYIGVLRYAANEFVGLCEQN